MADLDSHADAVAKFYKRLKEAGVDEQAAGVCTIDLNKSLLSREPPKITPEDKDAQRAEIRAASDRKAAERAAALKQA